MRVVESGYLIPFARQPKPFHRAANSPDLLLHKEAAWRAMKKDMGHGAVLPCNLARDGKPMIVSPVRTAPKGWRSTERRFVINMRYLNSHIEESESSCDLDTISKIRNLLLFDHAVSDVSYFISLDLKSGYHNFWIDESQWKLMGFALGVDELPPEAVKFLRSEFPDCEDRETGTFYFLMRALPFGLAPSCAVFSDVTTALAAAWRRSQTVDEITRLTSYIDDFLALEPTVCKAIALAFRLVFNVTSSGLSLQIPKCNLVPYVSIVFLGLLLDSTDGSVSLPPTRVTRMSLQASELYTLGQTGTPVATRSIAQFAGLLWSASPCAPRAIPIMARGLTDVLTDAMHNKVYGPHKRSRYTRRFSLKRLLAQFWDGEVQLTDRAMVELRFWVSLDFASLRAPISADTMQLIADSVLLDTSTMDLNNFVAFVTDASDSACGGGLLTSYGTDGGFSFDPNGVFFSPLPNSLRSESSTLRELYAIWWMLQSLPRPFPKRVIAFTDSRAACNVIKRGSRFYHLHRVAMNIFVHCLVHDIVISPCWSPRSHRLIREADRRSRWSDRHDRRTPPRAFAIADSRARALWGRGITFDRQASHLNAMPPPEQGPTLPFNSLWLQPGSAGVDMFLQPPESWLSNINYVFPAGPTVGRVLTFLPSTRSKVVVAIPLQWLQCGSWWDPWTSPTAPGLLESVVVEDFRILFFDHGC